jgi:hypothetical protein
MSLGPGEPRRDCHTAARGFGMDHFTSPEPPHADVRRAVGADLLALANYEHESPLSIAETMNGPTWLDSCARDLVACVGSVEALESLDAESHRAEELEFDGLEPEDAELAGELVDLIGEAQLALDPEMVTIIHRMVGRLAAHPDKPLRRRAQTPRIAAAIVWVALSASGMVGRRSGTRSATDIWFAFDTSSASDIGHSLAHALRNLANDDTPDRLVGISHPPMLTDPALLHSRYRRSLVDRRHELKRAIRDQQQREIRDHPIQVRHGEGVRFATTPTTIRWAVRSHDENGRATVMLANGDLQGMQLISISVPDAYRLIAALEHALSEPLAKAS